MALFHKRHPVGARPGTLILPEQAEPPRIRVFRYDADAVEEIECPDLAALDRLRQNGKKLWVDVEGVGDEAILRGLGDRFGLHPLLLEDVVNVPQRPKNEQYEHHHFFVLRMLRLVRGELDVEQVSVVLGDGYVLTFQERRGGDVLDPVRARLRSGLGPIRVWGCDYLAYALIDTIVDNYYPVIEEVGEQLEALEEQVLRHADDHTMRELSRMKGVLLTLRRAIWPLRDSLGRLLRDGSPRIAADVLVYLRDTVDHAVQTADITEAYRELAAGLMNTQLSVLQQRAGEVMKVLTIMASIFIPLTFLAGIYGMNLRDLPGAEHPHAGKILIGTMIGLGLIMLYAFRRRGWIGRR